MTREVVFDANVIVAWLDEADVLATRARVLMQRLRDEGGRFTSYTRFTGLHGKLVALGPCLHTVKL
jgi:hypothetical protein